MKSRHFAVSLALLAGALFGQSAFAKDNWTLAKDAEGIKVYVRDVDGSSLREFRGEVQLNASPEKVVGVLRDADAFRKWMPNVVASELLKSTDTDQFHYVEVRAPWPVSNRDGVYHFTFSRAGDGAVTVRIEAVPDYLPPRDGKVRVPQADGRWKVTPNADGVKVSYQVHAAPGGAIPGWLANQAVVDTPYDTLTALRAYVQAQTR